MPKHLQVKSYNGITKVTSTQLGIKQNFDRKPADKNRIQRWIEEKKCFCRDAFPHRTRAPRCTKF